MTKSEKLYNDDYGDIRIDDTDRLLQYLNENPLSRTKKKISEEISRISRIEWETISFTLYLVPKATPRPRSNFKTHIFYVSGGKSNKEFFMKEFCKLDLDMIVTPMKFYSSAYLPMPKSMPKIDQILGELGMIRPISKPDFDNLAKTYTDMITSSLIYDDALIIEGTMKKFYSWKPRVEVTIEYMKDFDSEFNRRKIYKKGR